MRRGRRHARQPAGVSEFFRLLLDRDTQRIRRGPAFLRGHFAKRLKRFEQLPVRSETCQLNSMLWLRYLAVGFHLSKRPAWVQLVNENLYAVLLGVRSRLFDGAGMKVVADERRSNAGMRWGAICVVGAIPLAVLAFAARRLVAKRATNRYE